MYLTIKPRTAHYSFFKKHLAAALTPHAGRNRDYSQRARKAFQLYLGRRTGKPLTVVAHAYFRSGKIIERQSVQRSSFFRALSRRLVCSDNIPLFSWLNRRGFYRLSVRTQLRALSSAFPFLSFRSRARLLSNYYDYADRVKSGSGQQAEMGAGLSQTISVSPKIFPNNKLTPFSNSRAVPSSLASPTVAFRQAGFLAPVAEVLRRRYGNFTFSTQATLAPYYSFMGSRLRELVNYTSTLYPSFPVQLLTY